MTLQDHSPSDQERSTFVPVADAARILGVSTATIKRRITSGLLEAEQIPRPQGIEYRVRLPRDVTPPLAAPLSDVTRALTGSAPSELVALTGSAHVTTQDVSAAITAAIAPLTERLVAQEAVLARHTETIGRQAEEIAGLREDRGRLTAELSNAQARCAELEQERSRLVAEKDAAEATQSALASAGPPQPIWHRWWLLWFGLAGMAIVLLLVWPR